VLLAMFKRLKIEVIVDFRWLISIILKNLIWPINSPIAL